MTTRKLAIIHTTPVTVEPLRELAGRFLPEHGVINFVDDSILPQLNETGGDLSRVEERLLQYAAYGEEAGAEAILNACSSVGEAVGRMRERVAVPVVRIDEAMAEEAIGRGADIAVAATLPTTLQPTLTLLERKAREAGREVDLRPVLAEEAYQRLLAGDGQGHDEILALRLAQAAREADIVVLAQASMARAVASLPPADRSQFLASPESGMKRMRDVVRSLPRA